jgi:hypothetical protein
MTHSTLNERMAVLLTSGQPVPQWLGAWWISAGLGLAVAVVLRQSLHRVPGAAAVIGSQTKRDSYLV